MMDLKSLRVQNYRCIDDSGWVTIDDLTCFIGKNESGKTTFMNAVEKLNPAHRTGEFDPSQEYPRNRWPAYSDRHDDDPDVVASARFRLDQSDRRAIADQYVPDLIGDPVVTVHKNYQNELSWEIEINDSAVIEYLLERYEFSSDTQTTLRETTSLSDLGSAGPLDEINSVTDDISNSGLVEELGAELLTDRLPQFRYVGEYSIIEGTVELDRLLADHESDEVDPSDRGFLSLLSAAGIDLEEFDTVTDWRAKATELEAGSSSVSTSAMQYWSQSGDVQVRVQPMTAGDDDRRVLDLRVEDREHDITVGFDQRSHGFRRFFSTFCQLFEFSQHDEEMVLLLDEPGLNLHARAKQEFLTFLKSEVASQHPVMYSTHSPFMIDATALHRVHMVSSEPAGETNVFSDIQLADEYTQFPLRNVFELDLMDTLLVRPQVLLVEQKATHVYLYVLSKILKDAGNTGLDDRWTVIPVKNADNIDSFAALFGDDLLDVAALLSEAPTQPDQRARRGTTDERQSGPPMTVLSEFTASRGRSTIEDVLDESFYLALVSQTYANEISRRPGAPSRLSPAELSNTDPDAPIVERLEAYFQQTGINGGEFDRTKPALYLQNNRMALGDEIDSESRRNFSQLFTETNNILESFESIDTTGGGLFSGLFG
ncbi:MAG: hypothetical protein J07HX5_01176 [halophilic archaeon J07HX5]|nr:MAG: hypothetical protein J07HX5_01176 [halophilic archaeon J07HX5]